jgi:hypothetical protein
LQGISGISKVIFRTVLIENNRAMVEAAGVGLCSGIANKQVIEN